MQSDNSGAMAVREAVNSDLLERLDRQSERIETPCGNGRMVWRRWGSGPIIILLHGGFGSWNHWCRNIVTLARESTVIAPDLPGLGESDVPGDPGDPEHLARILSNGLDEILGPDVRFDLGCFSFGAVPGSLLAVSYAERVRSFTLVGAAGFGPRDRPTDGLIRIRRDMDEATRRTAARNNLEVLMFADPSKVDDLAVDIQLCNTDRARFRSRPFSLSDTVLQALPKIRARRNAIWGAEDVTALGMLERRNAAVRAADPDAHVAVIEAAGHWVQYEAADEFNRSFLEMVRRSA
ncbi:alpha/beta fold hydrolase [Nisaea acidiphila]|uniref:Alpha/beta fold hydrolase n=1 Tax=Nisaea acidiphila TaxID=1862145 RepID=A0A9J7AQY0_9PROT|nr:alpha/beta fold hydrolase [Nisaea acidiphila]UUX49792.1 alpha/beta fold hydrolase [Nisaea acidiphila]